MQERSKFDYAKAILQLGEQGDIRLYASYLTYANMAYILRHRPVSERYHLLREARAQIDVIPPTIEQLDYALTHEVEDFEDMLQYRCALEAGCDVIVTNNPADFAEFCTIPFLTSEEFLMYYFKAIEGR